VGDGGVQDGEQLVLLLNLAEQNVLRNIDKLYQSYSLLAEPHLLALESSKGRVWRISFSYDLVGDHLINYVFGQDLEEGKGF